MMIFKLCSKCGLIKDETHFYKDPRGKFGLYGHCKNCHGDYLKTDKSRKQRRDYKTLIRSNPAYVVKEREKSRLRMAEYYKDPIIREKLKKSATKYANKRMKTDICFRIRRNLRCRLSRLLKEIKNGSAVTDLGCSMKFFIAYIKSKFYRHPKTGEQMTWKNWGRREGNWNLDHIKELCLFDLSKREEFLKACHYSNIQPLWFVDHKEKTKKFLKEMHNAPVHSN
jgi:hypothetical protein